MNTFVATYYPTISNAIDATATACSNEYFNYCHVLYQAQILRLKFFSSTMLHILLLPPTQRQRDLEISFEISPSAERGFITGVGTKRFHRSSMDSSARHAAPIARTEKRLGPADSDRWVSVARCIDWPIWQEKNAAVANTWPQPAEWPAEHCNAACVSFLPIRRRPSLVHHQCAIRVISASRPDLTNCNLILEPRKSSTDPRLFSIPQGLSTLLPSLFLSVLRHTQGDSAWEPGQFDEKTCVFLLQGPLARVY